MQRAEYERRLADVETKLRARRAREHRALYKRGLSMRAIAARTGWGLGTVQRDLGREP